MLPAPLEPQGTPPASADPRQQQAKSAEEVLRGLVREHVREALTVAEAEGGGSVVQTLSMQIMRRQAPLPTPEEMAGYKAVDPELPKLIAGMAQRALEVRHEDQKAFRTTEHSRIRSALVAVIALVIGGTVIGVFGTPAAGATVITSTVVGLAGVFITGKWINTRKAAAAPKDEDEEHEEEER